MYICRSYRYTLGMQFNFRNVSLRLWFIFISTVYVEIIHKKIMYVEKTKRSHGYIIRGGDSSTGLMWKLDQFIHIHNYMLSGLKRLWHGHPPFFRKYLKCNNNSWKINHKSFYKMIYKIIDKYFLKKSSPPPVSQTPAQSPTSDPGGGG